MGSDDEDARHPSLAPTASSPPASRPLRAGARPRRTRRPAPPAGSRRSSRPGPPPSTSTGRARQTTTFSSPRKVNAPGIGTRLRANPVVEVRSARLPVDDPVGGRCASARSSRARDPAASAERSASAAAARTRGSAPHVRPRFARTTSLRCRRRAMSTTAWPTIAPESAVSSTISKSVTPVRASPERIAHGIAARPRWRGSRVGCMPNTPSRASARNGERTSCDQPTTKISSGSSAPNRLERLAVVDVGGLDQDGALSARRPRRTRTGRSGSGRSGREA